MWSLGLVILCSCFWSCLFRGKVASMSDVHRSEHLTLFPVLKVYSGSGSPDLESLGIVAKGL